MRARAVMCGIVRPAGYTAAAAARSRERV